MGKKPWTTYGERRQNRAREYIYVESFMKREVAMTEEAIKRLRVNTTKLGLNSTWGTQNMMDWM